MPRPKTQFMLSFTVLMTGSSFMNDEDMNSKQRYLQNLVCSFVNNGIRAWSCPICVFNGLVTWFWYRLCWSAHGPGVHNPVAIITRITFFSASELRDLYFLHFFCSASTSLFGRLSAKHPRTVDKDFLEMHSHHDVYFKLRGHRHTNFYLRFQIVCPWHGLTQCKLSHYHTQLQ